MVRIMLVCNMGMSTSMLVKKMEEAAGERGLEARIWAVAEGKVTQEADEADVVLLGPQIRYLKDEVAKKAPGTPVAVIDIACYGRMDGAGALDQALGLMP